METGQLPSGIGPQEGREFDLLAGGKKDIALFSDYRPADLDRFLLDHTFFLTTVTFHLKNLGAYHVYIVARRGHETSVDALLAMIDPDINAGFDEERERCIGARLGYSNDEIGAWLSWISPRG